MSAKFLLDPAHRAVLDEWACGSTLFAFDFDGTLAPIVQDPREARMSAQNAELFASLARRACVAVVSGRSRENLTTLVPPEATYLVGNHGNEGLPTGDPDVSEKRQITASWRETLLADATLWRQADGAMLEDKGVSLSLHYRHCTNRVMGRSVLVSRAAALTPAPRLIRGCLVINLLPPHSMTKREALQTLMQHSGCQYAMFVGDDLTDELAFQDAPENWLTVRVGECVHTDARYRLKDVSEVSQLLFHLESMRRALSPERRSGGMGR